MKKVSKFLALCLAGVLTAGAMGNQLGDPAKVYAYENKFYNGPVLAPDGGDTGLKSIVDDTSDYYTVELPSDGALVINITGYNISSSDIIIYEYDSPEESITFSYFMNADDDTGVYKYPLSAGKYVVRLEMNDTKKYNQPARYRILTKFESYGKNQPRDSYNNPKNLVLNNKYNDSITLNDEKDWYRFTLSEDTYCQMKFSAIGNFVGCDMYDVDLQNNYGFITCYCKETEEVTNNMDYFLPAGTYYFVVNKRGGCAKYSFSLNTRKVGSSSVSKVKAQTGGKALVTFVRNDDATGYQVRYSTDKNFRKKVKTKTFTKEKATSKGKKLTYKLTKLKKKKTYYVQVRSYVDVKGKKYYSDWSKSKKVKTR